MVKLGGDKNAISECGVGHVPSPMKVAPLILYIDSGAPFWPDLYLHICKEEMICPVHSFRVEDVTSG
jgi:hypothetical protein